jgi:hypothetical protein
MQGRTSLQLQLLLSLGPACPSRALPSADPHPGNLLKVTEGPHAGKLALLDFGLVAEIPSVRCLLLLKSLKTLRS